MTEISLVQATHVFNRVKAETAFQSPDSPDPDEWSYRRRSRRGAATKANVFNLTANVSVDHNVVELIEEQRKRTLEKLDRFLQLVDIGTKLRNAITEQQTKAGVTQYLTQRVATLNKIAVLQHLLASVDNAVFDKSRIGREAEAIRSRLGGQTGVATAHVATPVLNELDRTSLTRRLSEQRSELMRIDDNLGRLNNIHRVNIDDKDMEILRAAGLAG